jgi:hypothetical protein
MNRLTPARVANLLKMYGPALFKIPPSELVEFKSSPRTSPHRLGKRKRLNGQNLSRKGRLFKVGDSKRRKVHAPYRCISNTNITIERLKDIIGNNVHQLIVNKGSIKGYIDDKSKQSYYLIGIMNYTTGGVHGRHAISAVKVTGRTVTKRIKIHGKKMYRYVRKRVGDNLYVFDPHGHGRAHITNDIARNLASKLHVNKIIIYNGSHLQARNKVGACVGFSSDFLERVHGGSLRLRKSSFNRDVSRAFRVNAKNPSTMIRSLTRFETPGPNSSVPRVN